MSIGEWLVAVGGALVIIGWLVLIRHWVKSRKASDDVKKGKLVENHSEED